MNIAQNAVEKLNHGWFLVKNRSTLELLEGVTLQQRDANEKLFFQKQPWNTVAKDRTGIEPLTRFLSTLLLTHIRKEFPQLLSEIEALAIKTQSQLKTYGEKRQTMSEQRRFLRKMAAQYQGIVFDGLNGVYLLEVEEDDPSKLRWRIRTENEAFAQKFAKQGHKWTFKTSQNTDDPEFAEEVSDNEDQSESSDDGDKQVATERDIYYWIRKVHHESKGIELPGTLNPQVITTVFRKQSEPWEELSKNHLSTVKKIVDQYLFTTFPKVAKDPDVLENLTRFLRPRIVEGHLEADQELEKILQDEREGILQTVNHYLADTKEQIRKDREAQRLKDSGYQDGFTYKLSADDMFKSILKSISNDQSAMYDIHDTVKSYYKVAMKRFLDNVVIQVIERHILGPKSPLRLFSSDFVDDLEDEQVKFIAAESSSTSMARSDLTTKLDRLKKALDIAQGVSLTR